MSTFLQTTTAYEEVNILSQCPRCKKKVEEYYNFCSNCGLNLKEGETRPRVREAILLLLGELFFSCDHRTWKGRYREGFVFCWQQFIVYLLFLLGIIFTLSSSESLWTLYYIPPFIYLKLPALPVLVILAIFSFLLCKSFYLAALISWELFYGRE